MAGLKPKSNLLEMWAGPQGLQPQPRRRARAVWSSPGPWGEVSGRRQAAGGRSRRVLLSSSSHDSAGRFSFSLFISSVWSGHLKWYCCDRICVFAGTACPSCSIQTSHFFPLWPCVHLVPPALAPAAQSRLLRADPYVCDNTATF